MSASVTISDVVARSSPDAAARFIIPGRPSYICCASHPAIAMYPMASPASFAENFVCAPISLARSRNLSMSSADDPDIAATLDMELSKSAAVFTAAVPSPVTAAVTGSIFSPADVSDSPIFPDVSEISASFADPDPTSFSSDCRLCSVSMIVLFRASYCSWDTFPSWNFCCTSPSSFFRSSSFSFVFPISSDSALCFCCNSSVFVGSSFSNLSISLSSVCVVFIFAFRPSSDCCI